MVFGIVVGELISLPVEGIVFGTVIGVSVSLIVIGIVVVGKAVGILVSLLL